MSWQVYVDSNLVGTGSVKFGAISGLDGSIWAKSNDWNITQAEISKIATSFEDSSSLAMSGKLIDNLIKDKNLIFVFFKGLVLGGEKYFYLSGDSSIVRGKKGTNGVHIAKTKTALIIATYQDPTQPNQCASVVESLADYLRDKNY